MAGVVNTCPVCGEKAYDGSPLECGCLKVPTHPPSMRVPRRKNQTDNLLAGLLDTVAAARADAMIVRDCTDAHALFAQRRLGQAIVALANVVELLVELQQGEKP